MAPTNRTTVVSRATLASCGLLGLAVAAAGCERYEHHAAPAPSRAEPEAHEATQTAEPSRTPAPKPPGSDATEMPTTPAATTTTPQSPSAEPADEAEAAAEEQVVEDAIDPEAVAALRRMGEYLRTLRSFEVRGSAQTDDVLENGQTVQFSSTATLHVVRPNRLMAEVVSDGDERRYYYDGQTFTIDSPQRGYYASVDAPGTLGELVEVAGDRYGIDLPMVDLFLWGTDSDDAESLTSAIDLGPSQIGDVETEHYAFREEGLDWQVWITQGDRPLPRMLVLTTTDEEARPTHSVVYRWNLHPDHEGVAFSFRPRASSHRIELQDQIARAEDLRHVPAAATDPETTDPDTTE